MRIALDAMGGDYAPSVTVEGAVEAVSDWDNLEVILVGDEEELHAELAGKEYPSGRITIRHASQVVDMDESISKAVRGKRDSSIRRAIELVKSGEAGGAVSAGNSGVTMALSLMLLKTAPGVERPPIATHMPSFNLPFLLLDAGANVDCQPAHLLQFAFMADAYARLIMERPKPRVALLSIGEEATKGNELTKEAYKLLEKSNLNFVGNMESKDLFMGGADVAVCDGFIGNIFLKTSEGLAEVTMKMLKREIAGMTRGKLGYLLIKPALKNFRKLTDYAEYGGAPLLGLNGTCIISHGRSTTKAVKNALRVAAEFTERGVAGAVADEIVRNAPMRDGDLEEGVAEGSPGSDKETNPLVSP